MAKNRYLRFKRSLSHRGKLFLEVEKLRWRFWQTLGLSHQRHFD